MKMKSITKTTLSLGAFAAFAGLANAATLISHYSFDSGDGFTDIAGSNDGTAVGGASISTGVGNSVRGDGALLLNGSTGYVNIDGLLGDLPDTTADFSVAAWFRTSDVASNIMFSANNTSGESGTANHYLFGLTGDQEILSHVGSGIGTAGVGTGGLADGAWHHGVATYNATTSTHTLYVDGVSVGTAVGTVNWTPAVRASIGMELDGTTAGNFWDGSIDDMRIYSGELTTVEIGNLYTAVPEPTTSALLGIGGLALILRRRK